MHVKEYLREWSDTNKNRGSCAKWAAFHWMQEKEIALPFFFKWDSSPGGWQL